MNNLSVRIRLTLLVAFSLAALLLVGLGGWVGIGRVGSALSDIGDNKLPAVSALSEIRAQQYALYAYTLEAATWEKEQYANSHFKDILERKKKAAALFDKALKDYAAGSHSADEEKAWNTVQPALKRWREFDTKLNAVIATLGENSEFDKQAGIFEQYYLSITDWKDAQYAVERNLGKLVEINVRDSLAARQTGAAAHRTAKGFMSSIFAVATLVLIALGLLIMRSIVKPLEAMRKTIVTVAENNDFRLRADVKSRDEAGQTARAFNQLIEQIQSSLRGVLDNAERISSAAHKASQASSQVSDASNRQSESASAMAAAIEQMTVSVSHITDSTRDALHRAEQAGSAADSGAEIISGTDAEMDQIGSTVKTAGTAIDELGSQSERISAIMQVIREVADQTNLLALNAAIEAARAGEQGRGFAVVADEVRKLAERTSRATEEIAQMVVAMHSSTKNAVSGMNSVADQVSRGKEFSAQASTRMAEIRSSASDVTRAVNEISAALAEQSAVAQDIARQVETVANMSEDNSGVAEETTHVAQELDALAAALREEVNHFKV
ncbi:methyl-accepting chemotaxis protein [Niveibacterium terrae]|uniref:methyl-accepting chemotaxis protein n=1 Tax=Niveibacterium terrae TaxID=3373598 RepID=UPI003A944605